MERRKEEDLGNIIMRYLRQSQLETPLNEFRLIQAWAEVMGPQVERYTKDLRIYNQVLHVTLRSAAIRNELLMRRSDIMRRLNGQVGANVIHDITFA